MNGVGPTDIVEFCDDVLVSVTVRSLEISPQWPIEGVEEGSETSSKSLKVESILKVESLRSDGRIERRVMPTIIWVVIIRMPR